MALAVVCDVGSEVECAGAFVNAFNAENLEVALGDLVLQLRVRGKRAIFVKRIQIKMGMAVAPAWPNELIARVQDAEVVVCLDPGIALLAEHLAGFSAGC